MSKTKKYNLMIKATRRLTSHPQPSGPSHWGRECELPPRRRSPCRRGPLCSAGRGPRRRSAGLTSAVMHFRKMHFRKMHFSKILQIFGGLVLGCIKTKFCNKICVWQHFSSSTRFASFCTAAISNFSQKIGLKNCEFRKISENFRKFWQILLGFWKKCDFGAVQRSALCRSRRELSNSFFLAKFGLDTAENEPCQVCPTPRNAAAN